MDNYLNRMGDTVQTQCIEIELQFATHLTMSLIWNSGTVPLFSALKLSLPSEQHNTCPCLGCEFRISFRPFALKRMSDIWSRLITHPTTFLTKTHRKHEPISNPGHSSIDIGLDLICLNTIDQETRKGRSTKLT